MTACYPQYLVSYLQQGAPHWSAIATAIATPLLALLAAIIAWNQWQTARRKLKLDLFDRRIVVYDAAKNALGIVVSSGKWTQKNEQDYLLGIAGAQWLFNKTITAYLQEVLWRDLTLLASMQATGDRAGTQLIGLSEKLREIDNIFEGALRLQH